MKRISSNTSWPVWVYGTDLVCKDCRNSSSADRKTENAYADVGEAIGRFWRKPLALMILEGIKHIPGFWI